MKGNKRRKNESFRYWERLSKLPHGHRTWFSKKEQRWVSDIPEAFWIGACDPDTGEKIYSDDTVYFSYLTPWYFKIKSGYYPIKNAREYQESEPFKRFPVSVEEYCTITKNPVTVMDEKDAIGEYAQSLDNLIKDIGKLKRIIEENDTIKITGTRTGKTVELDNRVLVDSIYQESDNVMSAFQTALKNIRKCYKD